MESTKEHSETVKYVVIQKNINDGDFLTAVIGILWCSVMIGVGHKVCDMYSIKLIYT